MHNKTRTSIKMSMKARHGAGRMDRTASHGLGVLSVMKFNRQR